MVIPAGPFDVALFSQRSPEESLSRIETWPFRRLQPALRQEQNDGPPTNARRSKHHFRVPSRILRLHNVRNDLPVPDELAEGLRPSFANKAVPIWLAYAMQIFLDIHHVLRADVVQDLQASRTQVASTLTAYFSTSKTFENWPLRNETAVKYIRSFIDHYITCDAMTPPLRQLYNNVQLPPFSRLLWRMGIWQIASNSKVGSRG